MSRWEMISHYNLYDLYDISSVIFEMCDEFWYLCVDKNKLYDVLKMPSYIVEDWLWVNRKVIDEKAVEYHIERAEVDLKYQTKSKISHVTNEKSSEKLIRDTEEKLAILLSIRRSIKIGKIL